MPKALWLDLRRKGSHCRKRKSKSKKPKDKNNRKENFENNAANGADVTYEETEDSAYVVNPEHALILKDEIVVVDQPKPVPSFNVRDIFDESEDDL